MRGFSVAYILVSIFSFSCINYVGENMPTISEPLFPSTEIRGSSSLREGWLTDFCMLWGIFASFNLLLFLTRVNHVDDRKQFRESSLWLTRNLTSFPKINIPSAIKRTLRLLLLSTSYWCWFFYCLCSTSSTIACY